MESNHIKNIIWNQEGLIAAVLAKTDRLEKEEIKTFTGGDVDGTIYEEKRELDEAVAEWALKLPDKAAKAAELPEEISIPEVLAKSYVKDKNYRTAIGVIRNYVEGHYHVRPVSFKTEFEDF